MLVDLYFLFWSPAPHPTYQVCALSVCVLLRAACHLSGRRDGSPTWLCASVFCRGQNKQRRRNYGNYLICSDDTDVAALPLTVIHDATLAQGASIKDYTNVKERQPAHKYTLCVQLKFFKRLRRRGALLFFCEQILGRGWHHHQGRGGLQPGPNTSDSAQPRRRRRRFAKSISVRVSVNPSVCLSACRLDKVPGSIVLRTHWPAEVLLTALLSDC